MNLKKCLVRITLLCFCVYSFDSSAIIKLESILQRDKLSSQDLEAVRKALRDNPKDSLRTFMSVISNKEFPDRSRWLSLILISKTMGRKSVPLLAKYLEHPNWMLRSAAIKSLKSLKVSDKNDLYRKLLKDKSYIIREQALDVISTLKIKSLKYDVLEMFGDKTNYIKTTNGLKASEVLKKVIKTLVALDTKESISLLRRLKKSQLASNIHNQIDLAIKQISL